MIDYKTLNSVLLPIDLTLESRMFGFVEPERTIKQGTCFANATAECPELKVSSV